MGEGLQVVAPDGRVAPTPHTAFLALDGSPDHLTLSIGYDGRTQSVDLDVGEDGGHETGRDPGPFAALDRVPAAPASTTTVARGSLRLPRGLGLRRIPGLGRGSMSVASVTRLPYVAGLGWAAAGTSWLVASVSHGSVVDVRVPRADGDVFEELEDRDLADVAFRLDGRAPVSAVHLNDVSGGLSLQEVSDPVQLVFAVPASAGAGASTLTARDERAVHTAFPVHGDADVDPVLDRVVLRWRVRLPA